jgi:ABC-type transporter MlaC component
MKQKRLLKKTEKQQKEAYYAEEVKKSIKRKAEEIAKRLKKEGPNSYSLLGAIIGKYEKQANRDLFKEEFKKYAPEIYNEIFNKVKKKEIFTKPEKETEKQRKERVNKLYETELKRVREENSKNKNK